MNHFRYVFASSGRDCPLSGSRSFDGPHATGQRVARRVMPALDFVVFDFDDQTRPICELRGTRRMLRISASHYDKEH